MANKTIHMTKVRQILRLHSEGSGSKEIYRLTGVSRNTVKRYIQQFTIEELIIPDVDLLSDYELDMRFAKLTDIRADPRLEHLQTLLPAIEKRLKRPGMTLTKSWEQYQTEHLPGYGHTQFYRHYRL